MGVLLVLLGGVGFVAGLGWTVARARFVRGAQRVVGRVVDESFHGVGEDRGCTQLISYIGADGREAVFSEELAVEDGRRAVGQTVAILVPAGGAAPPRVDSAVELWLWPISVLSFGVSTVAFGVILILAG